MSVFARCFLKPVAGDAHATLRQSPLVAVIVLGKKLRPDGSASEELVHRVQCGVEVYRELKSLREGVRLCFIVTGAAVQSNPCGLTEATVMRDVAVSAGMPAEDVVLEDKALNTIENLIYTRQLLLGMGSLVEAHLVTSDYHMERSRLILNAVLRPSFPKLNVACHPDPALISPEQRERELAVEVRMTSLLPTHLGGCGLVLWAGETSGAK